MTQIRGHKVRSKSALRYLPQSIPLHITKAFLDSTSTSLAYRTYRQSGSDANAVRTPIPSRIDLAGNTSYNIAASRTASHGCRLTMAQDRLRLLAHVYDNVASIHMTETPGRHG